MELLLSVVLFVLLAGLVSLIATRLWARPKAAVERVAGIAATPDHQVPAHSSLVFHELIKSMGSLIPASPKDVGLMQRRLTRAGIRNPNASKLLYGAKVLLGVLFPLAAALLLAGSDTDSGNKIGLILVSLGLGFFLPNQFVQFLSKRRQKQIRKGLPNALDLLVVCVESGLGLDQALMQVSKEMQHAHRAISEEFLQVNLELKAGTRRAEALRNLAERTAVDELKKLVAVLIQADRFGTGVAQSLRSHSDYMRVQSRQRAEEKAAKLGVKLVFPIFFCILPSLFVVTVGPVVVRIVRELLPMMNNI